MSDTLQGVLPNRIQVSAEQLARHLEILMRMRRDDPCRIMAEHRFELLERELWRARGRRALHPARETEASSCE
jgi:hypothetical protein